MQAPAAPAKRLRLVVVVSAAVIYCALVAALTGPGFASFDTAYQWWMGRHAEFSTLWPPSYVVTFAGFDVFSPYIDAPTVWFCVNLTLLSAASSVIGNLCSRAPVGAVAIFLALAMSPVSWLLVPHVWSDVALVAVLLFSVACLLAAFSRDTNKRSHALLHCAALVCLFTAVGIRHNAMFAVLPLTTLWCLIALHTFLERYARRLRISFALMGAVLVTTVFALVHFGLSRVLATERSDTWAITAIWDLQALSIATNQVLVPPVISLNTNLVDLRASYDPANAVALYFHSKASWANSTTGLSHQQAIDLAAAWWQAVRATPTYYFAHRARAIALMLGIDQRDAITGSLIAAGTRVEPGQTSFRDNPTRAFWWNWGVNAWRHIGDYVTSSRWGTPAATLLMSLLAIMYHLTQRLVRRALSGSDAPMKSGDTVGSGQTFGHISPTLLPDTLPFAVTCLASGSLYFAGLFVAAPTADMRYAFWPVVAAILTAVFICTMRSPSDTGNPAAGITSPVS